MEEAAALAPADVEVPAAEGKPKRRPTRPKPAAKGAEVAPEPAAAGVAEEPKEIPAVPSPPGVEAPAEPATKPRKRTPRAKPGVAKALPVAADSGEAAPEPAAPKKRAPRRKAPAATEEEQEA
jgi:hypothetical protein